MALLLPLSGRLTDRFGARATYTTGIAMFGLTVFPVFALFGTRNIAWYGAGGIGVYQLSGIYASSLTPLILVALIRADHGSPWYACGYLVATAVISVGATVLLKPG